MIPFFLIWIPIGFYYISRTLRNRFGISVSAESDPEQSTLDGTTFFSCPVVSGGVGLNSDVLLISETEEQAIEPGTAITVDNSCSVPLLEDRPIDYHTIKHDVRQQQEPQQQLKHRQQTEENAQLASGKKPSESDQDSPVELVRGLVHSEDLQHVEPDQVKSDPEGRDEVLGTEENLKADNQVWPEQAALERPRSSIEQALEQDLDTLGWSQDHGEQFEAASVSKCDVHDDAMLMDNKAHLDHIGGRGDGNCVGGMQLAGSKAYLSEGKSDARGVQQADDLDHPGEQRDGNRDIGDKQLADSNAHLVECKVCLGEQEDIVRDLHPPDCKDHPGEQGDGNSDIQDMDADNKVYLDHPAGEQAHCSGEQVDDPVEQEDDVRDVHPPDSKDYPGEQGDGNSDIQDVQIDNKCMAHLDHPGEQGAGNSKANCSGDHEQVDDVGNVQQAYSRVRLSEQEDDVRDVHPPDSKDYPSEQGEGNSVDQDMQADNKAQACLDHPAEQGTGDGKDADSKAYWPSEQVDDRNTEQIGSKVQFNYSWLRENADVRDMEQIGSKVEEDGVGDVQRADSKAHLDHPGEQGAGGDIQDMQADSNPGKQVDDVRNVSSKIQPWPEEMIEDDVQDVNLAGKLQNSDVQDLAESRVNLDHPQPGDDMELTKTCLDHPGDKSGDVQEMKLVDSKVDLDYPGERRDDNQEEFDQVGSIIQLHQAELETEQDVNQLDNEFESVEINQHDQNADGGGYKLDPVRNDSDNRLESVQIEPHEIEQGNLLEVDSQLESVVEQHEIKQENQLESGKVDNSLKSVHEIEQHEIEQENDSQLESLEIEQREIEQENQLDVDSPLEAVETEQHENERRNQLDVDSHLESQTEQREIERQNQDSQLEKVNQLGSVEIRQAGHYENLEAKQVSTVLEPEPENQYDADHDVTEVGQDKAVGKLSSPEQGWVYEAQFQSDRAQEEVKTQFEQGNTIYQTEEGNDVIAATREEDYHHILPMRRAHTSEEPFFFTEQNSQLPIGHRPISRDQPQVVVDSEGEMVAWSPPAPPPTHSACSTETGGSAYTWNGPAENMPPSQTQNNQCLVPEDQATVENNDYYQSYYALFVTPPYPYYYVMPK